jgi:hypothetical protein
MLSSGGDTDTVQRKGIRSLASPSNIWISGRYVPVMASYSQRSSMTVGSSGCRTNGR